MNILFAPDSFKGSINANEFCTIAAEVCSHYPQVFPTFKALADGGEGTVEAIVEHNQGDYHLATVSRPHLGKRTTARFGELANKTFVIEMAEASGLPLMKGKLDPFKASTYGTGELIANALDMGAKQIIIGIGGSATNDGGIGALTALGYRFTDSKGEQIEPNNSGLAQLAHIDTAHAHPKLKQCKLTLAVDVENPLLGDNGATYTYAPQKGADANDLRVLEANLARFAQLAEATTQRSGRDIPGAGAGGGIAFALNLFLDAQYYSGVQLCINHYQLEAGFKHKKWDIAISGEGKTDQQSLMGKAPIQLAQLAQKYDTPCILISGQLDIPPHQLYDQGVTAALSLASGVNTLDELIVNTPQRLAEQLHNTLRLLITR